MFEQSTRILPLLLAVTAGILDWRSMRIPNWLTLPALVIGFAVNAWLRGWVGAKNSLLGAGLGLGVLLWFVMRRILGAGDWKLVGALGAFYGPGKLLDVLFLTVLVNGLIGLGLLIKKRRVLQTVRNMGRLLASLFGFPPPYPELTVDDPKSIKVRFGVAVAIAVVLYTVLGA